MPRGKKYTRDQLVQLGTEAQEACAREGIRLTSTRFREITGVSQHVYEREFGNWAGAATCFGAEPGRTTTPMPDYERTPEEVAQLEGAHNYVVTSAQNNTPPDPDFLAALRVYCREKEAAMVIGSVRYKNPNRREPGEDDSDVWWHPELEPHIIDNELRVDPLLRVMGRVRIAATTSNPLPRRRGGRTKAESAIYAHGQLRMTTVATPQLSHPKVLWSTGSVTVKNYSRADTADNAEFHHSLAAIVVETRPGRQPYTREINWDEKTKSFYDLGRVYTARGSRKAKPLAVLDLGDTHEYVMDSIIRESIHGSGGLIDTYRPRVLVEHDLFDAGTVNPHERANRISRAIRAAGGLSRVEDELTSLGEYFYEGSAWNGYERVAPASNHDDMLTRWLQGGEKHVDPENASLYHYLAWRLIEHGEENGGEIANPVEMWLDEYYPDHGVRFLKVDESFRVKDIELGMHGHLGCNGGKGSLAGLCYIGTRFVIGHGHGPGIMLGGYQNGVCQTKMGYAKGPSSWAVAHVGISEDTGKRQMIFQQSDGSHRG